MRAKQMFRKFCFEKFCLKPKTMLNRADEYFFYFTICRPIPPNLKIIREFRRHIQIDNETYVVVDGGKVLYQNATQHLH